MAAFGPQSILQRVADLLVQLDSSNELHIHVGDRVVDCGSHGLLVLDAFAWPVSVEAAMAGLQARSGENWMQLTSTIVLLHNAGVLREPTADHVRPLAESGFGAAPVHVRMLNDRVRTDAFVSAIREVVQPGDVVVDIGTGTGVLAVAAARAGAARVYAIEAGALASVADAIFAAEGLDNRITLVRGWSGDVELPERADVFISETIGDDPFDERLVELARDARQRFLKPHARFVPAHLTVFSLPVTIPAARLERTIATPEVLTRWHEWYGVDFAPLAAAWARNAHESFQMNPYEARNWAAPAAPIVLAETDLSTSNSSNLASRVAEGRARSAGVINGLLVYFEARLGSAVLSTHPQQASRETSWASPLWHFPTALTVQAGDRFQIRYEFTKGKLSRVSLVDPAGRAAGPAAPNARP
jgi:hypothetical protein